MIILKLAYCKLFGHKCYTRFMGLGEYMSISYCARCRKREEDMNWRESERSRRILLARDIF